MQSSPEETALNTIFTPCRQCGNCCKQYRKITLQGNEPQFIEKMGGHVGIDISFKDIREVGLERARQNAEKDGRIYMIHPDDKGCIFLERRNDTHFCKIYHYRPQSCKGFRCNMADESMMALTGNDAILLLGQNSFGIPLEND